MDFSFSEESSKTSNNEEKFEIYVPDGLRDDLVVDESAYVLLKYINPEWPAQSITVSGSKLYMGTNPESSYKDNTKILMIDLCSLDYSDLKFREVYISFFINKIVSTEDFLVAISDDYLIVLNKNLTLRHKIKGKFGYGLYVAENEIFVGCKDGRVEIYDSELNLKKSLDIHKKSVETICIKKGVIYTGSSDWTLKLTDLSGKNIQTISNNNDVNSLDVNDNGIIIFGDDNGYVHIINLEKLEEVITWHKTPISSVKWKDNDIFVSASDEQVCVWDISLCDNSNYHKYLLFVHQGQQYYKDIAFDGNKIITTSEDGICVFTPISFSEN